MNKEVPQIMLWFGLEDRHGVQSRLFYAFNTVVELNVKDTLLRLVLNRTVELKPFLVLYTFQGISMTAV